MKSLARKKLALALAFAFLSGLVLVSPPSVTAAEKKPNILFLFADDWGKFASIYAEVESGGGINDVVATPNFDRIAEEGMRFTRCYAGATVGAPSRSVLMTGQHHGHNSRARQCGKVKPRYPGASPWRFHRCRRPATGWLSHLHDGEMGPRRALSAGRHDTSGMLDCKTMSKLS